LNVSMQARACMDTFKDKQLLEDVYSRGEVTWQVWKHSSGAEAAAPVKAAPCPPATPSIKRPPALVEAVAK